MRFGQVVGRLSAPTIVLLGIIAVCVLGMLDWWTGPYVSLAVFYLIPITAVAWFVGRVPAVLLAALSGGSWFFDSRLGSPPDLPALVLIWMCLVRMTFFLVVTWLVSALKALVDHHKALATTDDMTCVPNRRAFLAAAAREVSRLRRAPAPLTVLYLDCDNFKAVNDRFGHAVGDDLLRHVARVLRSNIREQDMVARIGGDEFVVMLPECDRSSAEHVVSKLRALLAEVMAAHHWDVTFSLGVVTYRNPPRNVEDLLHAADALQYAVKRAGKNNVLHEERDALAGVASMAA